MAASCSLASPARRCFVFYVQPQAPDASTERISPDRIAHARASTAPHGAHTKVTLPPSWELAPVSRLLELIAARFGVKPRDCHLRSLRGHVRGHLAVSAAIVHKETITLARGPPPITASTAAADNGGRRSLWGWGRCGDGLVHPLPVRQPGIDAHQVHEIALGEEHALVVTREMLSLSWGANDFGQLGSGDERDIGCPSVVRALCAVRSAHPACGARCSAVISEEGELWSWGKGKSYTSHFSTISPPPFLQHLIAPISLTSHVPISLTHISHIHSYPLQVSLPTCRHTSRVDGSTAAARRNAVPTWRASLLVHHMPSSSPKGASSGAGVITMPRSSAGLAAAMEARRHHDTAFKSRGGFLGRHSRAAR